MASFLRPCTNDCGKQVRFMSEWDIPEVVICDPCVEAIAANEASAANAAKEVKRRPIKRTHKRR